VDLLPFIGQLLYRHNCVIVPGLGGFVTEYRSARINPGAGEFYPPDKAIAFNPRLERNDGLLAHSLAELESVPYPVAEEIVRQFAERCHQRLHRDRTLRFPGVGKLLLEDDAKMRFLPEERENFLEESFGLGVLKAQPLATGGSRIPPPSAVPELSEEEESGETVVPFGERWPKQAWWWAAAIVLFCFGFWQLMMSGLVLESNSLARLFAPRQELTIEEGRAAILHPLIPSLKRQMATFGPTTTLLSVTPVAILPIEDSTGYAAALAARDSLALRATWRQQNLPTAVESLARNQPRNLAPPVAQKPGLSGEAAPKPGNTRAKTEDPSPVKNSVATSASGILHNTQGPVPPSGFYLIVGSFPNAQEASKRLESISSPAGPRAVLLGENGKHRAAMWISADKGTAVDQLESLRSRFGQQDAWLLRFSGQ